MFYPDLDSLQAVDDLPMPEFNLRIHCVKERLGWERGGFAEDEFEPEVEMKPMGKKTLLEVLAQIKQKQLAEEDK